MIVRRPVYLPSENGQSTQEFKKQSTATTCKVTDRQRDHWRKLHTTRMTPEEFAIWVATIPGCATCKTKFEKILLVIPPVFGDGWEYFTFAVHNIVNADIGKPVVSWPDACEFWGWQSSQLHRDTASKLQDQ